MSVSDGSSCGIIYYIIIYYFLKGQSRRLRYKTKQGSLLLSKIRLCKQCEENKCIHMRFEVNSIKLRQKVLHFEGNITHPVFTKLYNGSLGLFQRNDVREMFLLVITLHSVCIC